jgi:hypothetical protein
MNVPIYPAKPLVNYRTNPAFAEGAVSPAEHVERKDADKRPSAKNDC